MSLNPTMLAILEECNRFAFDYDLEILTDYGTLTVYEKGRTPRDLPSGDTRIRELFRTDDPRGSVVLADGQLAAVDLFVLRAWLQGWNASREQLVRESVI